MLFNIVNYLLYLDVAENNLLSWICKMKVKIMGKFTTVFLSKAVIYSNVLTNYAVIIKFDIHLTDAYIHVRK